MAGGLAPSSLSDNRWQHPRLLIWASLVGEVGGAVALSPGTARHVHFRFRRVACRRNSRAPLVRWGAAFVFLLKYGVVRPASIVHGRNHDRAVISIVIHWIHAQHHAAILCGHKLGRAFGGKRQGSRLRCGRFRRERRGGKATATPPRQSAAAKISFDLRVVLLLVYYNGKTPGSAGEAVTV